MLLSERQTCSQRFSSSKQWLCKTNLRSNIFFSLQNVLNESESIMSTLACLNVQSSMTRSFFSLFRPTRDSEDDEDDEKKGKGCTLQVDYDQFLWDLLCSSSWRAVIWNYGEIWPNAEVCHTQNDCFNLLTMLESMAFAFIWLCTSVFESVK